MDKESDVLCKKKLIAKDMVKFREAVKNSYDDLPLLGFIGKIEFNTKNHDTRLVAEQALAWLKETSRIIDGIGEADDPRELKRKMIKIKQVEIHNL